MVQISLVKWVYLPLFSLSLSPGDQLTANRIPILGRVTTLQKLTKVWNLSQLWKLVKISKSNSLQVVQFTVEVLVNSRSRKALFLSDTFSCLLLTIDWIKILGNSYDQGKTFAVIYSVEGGCPLQSNYTVPIPKDLPNANSATFSWTWFNKVRVIRLSLSNESD